MKKGGTSEQFRMHITKDKLGGKAVEPGIYQARINTEFTSSKANKPMMKVEYNLLGTQPSGATAVGRKVFDNIVFEESMLWKFNQVFSAVTGEDLPEDSLTIDEIYGMISSAINGAMVTIEVVTEKQTDSDREQNRVKKFIQ